MINIKKRSNAKLKKHYSLLGVMSHSAIYLGFVFGLIADLFGSAFFLLSGVFFICAGWAYLAKMSHIEIMLEIRSKK